MAHLRELRTLIIVSVKGVSKKLLKKIAVQITTGSSKTP